MLFGRSEFIPEGAGISPDTPRKKGLARLVEIMSRDLDGIFLSGSLALLACVPAAALVGIALWMGSLPLCLLAACCTGWLVGPALTGLYDTILRALRDEPGFWWHTYKRVWKQSFKSSFLPGMIFTVLWALVGYAAFALPLMADVSTSFVWILLLDAVLLLTGLWVPNLLAMMAVYAPVEKSLHLEAKIHDVQNRSKPFFKIFSSHSL